MSVDSHIHPLGLSKSKVFFYQETDFLGVKMSEAVYDINCFGS